jgi:hypothetical protein
MSGQVSNHSGVSTGHKPVLGLVWHFFVHICVGTFIFVGIGFAAVVLHWFVNWVEAQGVLAEAVYVLTAVEYFLFVLDILAFLWFMVRIGWKFGVEIKEATK